jgi:hypothetical protein
MCSSVVLAVFSEIKLLLSAISEFMLLLLGILSCFHLQLKTVHITVCLVKNLWQCCKHGLTNYMPLITYKLYFIMCGS